jgi:hypothetical protein
VTGQAILLDVTAPDDDQQPPATHSEESAAQLVRIGGNLIAALQDYLVVAAAVRSREDDASTDDAYARVVQAMAVFDAAHLDHLDYSAPAGDIDDLEFDEELEDELEDVEAGEDLTEARPSVSRPD